MRTCYRLILAAWLLAGLCARADTIKLKDGTTVEGEIVAEDNSTVAILLEFAGGTITQTRHVSKTDIAAITRWTPQQKAERETQREYENLQKYQLNPVNSYPAEYYDQVISNVFRVFLAKHPNSPDVSNVAAHIVEWKAERDLVVAGNVKFRGRWSPAGEIAPLVERAWGQQLLQQGRELISQHRYEAAVERLQFVVRLERQPELVSLAMPLLTSAYQSAMNLLDQQQRQLAHDVFLAQERVDQAGQALRAAQALLPRPTGGGSPSNAEAQNAVDRARTELNTAQNDLESDKSQLAVVKQKLTTLKSRPPVAAISTSAPPATKAQPAPSPAPAPPAESPDVLGGLVTWAKKNWVAMLVIVAAILFFISRFLIKD
jgi:hypothetical protein